MQDSNSQRRGKKGFSISLHPTSQQFLSESALFQSPSSAALQSLKTPASKPVSFEVGQGPQTRSPSSSHDQEFMSPQSHFEEANSGSNVIEVAERTAIPVPISDSPELSPKKLTSPERITHQNVEVIDVDEMSAEVANGSKKSFPLDHHFFSEVNVRFENLGSLLRFGFPEAGGIESGDLTVESIACLAAKVDDVLMSAWNEVCALGMTDEWRQLHPDRAHKLNPWKKFLACLSLDHKNPWKDPKNPLKELKFCGEPIFKKPRARRSVGRLSRVAEASHAREEEDDIEVTSMTRRPDSFSSSPAPRQYATRSAKALETKFIELSMTPKRSRDNTCLDATPPLETYGRKPSAQQVHSDGEDCPSYRKKRYVKMSESKDVPGKGEKIGRMTTRSGGSNRPTTLNETLVNSARRHIFHRADDENDFQKVLQKNSTTSGVIPAFEIHRRTTSMARSEEIPSGDIADGGSRIENTSSSHAQRGPEGSTGRLHLNRCKKCKCRTVGPFEVCQPNCEPNAYSKRVDEAFIEIN